MTRRRIRENIYEDIQHRNMSFALTLVYFVLSFGITFYLTFIYLFNSKNYFITKFAFIMIFASVTYIFMVRHFIKFLGKTEIGEELDTFNNIAVVLSIAVFVLNTLLMFLLFVMLIFLVCTLIYGAVTGQFTFIHNFT